jgi:DNA polymerase I-like protein with 3'-5' exonuclease and polymerase domains
MAEMERLPHAEDSKSTKAQEEELFALDLETTGLDPRKDEILGIGLYSPRFGHHYFPDLASFLNHLAHLKSDLRKEKKRLGLVLHRGSFDLHFLAVRGCDLFDAFSFDTRSLASLLFPSPSLQPGESYPNSLQNLGRSLLHLDPWKLDRTRLQDFSPFLVRDYCLLDCEITFALYEFFKKSYDEKTWAFVLSWLMPVTRLCALMEWKGVWVESDGLQDFSQKAQFQKAVLLEKIQGLVSPYLALWQEKERASLREHYEALAEKACQKSKDPQARARILDRYHRLFESAQTRCEPFNFSSAQQLTWLLKSQLGLDLYDPLTKKETTSEAKLKELNHPVADLLIDLREQEKLISTCIPALLENQDSSGYVHSSYHVGGTRTGRLSSSGPNLQQIPRGPLRKYIQCRDAEHVLLTIDYAQIEVRLIAHFASEPSLLKAFQDGIDPYSLIAQKLLGLENVPVEEIKKKHPKERQVAKTIGLSILYGTGPQRLKTVLQKELGWNKSYIICREFIENYRASLPNVNKFKIELERKLSNRGVVFNLLGRPFAFETNEELYMKSLNTLVQGSASDLVLYSQTANVIPALERLGVYFQHRMLIHDEVVLELRKEEAELLTQQIIIPEMTSRVEKQLSLLVPLKVEYNISREWEKP